MKESKFKLVGDDMSDGYHTFSELYEHRNLLFINLCLMSPQKCAWREHYPGWPALFYHPPGGQISYHVQEKYLPLFKDRIEHNEKYEWDGHTSSDVLIRLQRFARK